MYKDKLFLNSPKSRGTSVLEPQIPQRSHVQALCDHVRARCGAFIGARRAVGSTTAKDI